MTLQDHGQPADTTTKKHRTGLIAVVAILAVALLALGGWLVIDSQRAPEPVQVTNISALGCTYDDDDNYTCGLDMSDPRVSGIETFQLGEIVFTEDGEWTVGSWTNPTTLTNDGGSWIGVQVGTTRWSDADPSHHHVVDTEYTGTGAYEGLVYHSHNEFIEFGDEVITGTIEQAE